MTKIVFFGWKVGARKIPFTKLLNNKAGLSLTEAKRIKDLIIDEDEVVEVEVTSVDVAKEIIRESEKLGIKAKLKD